MKKRIRLTISTALISALLMSAMVVSVLATEPDTEPAVEVDSEVVEVTEDKKTPVVKPKPVEVDKTRILKQFRRCDMDKTLEKLQRLLFAIGSRFNHMIFEKAGNKVQDCRNAIKEVF